MTNAILREYIALATYHGWTPTVRGLAAYHRIRKMRKMWGAWKG